MIEKTYIDGPARECVFQYEKHLSIERKDEPQFLREPSKENIMPSDLRLSCKKNEEIDATIPRKSTKRKPKKVHSKSNKAAMESI